MRDLAGLLGHRVRLAPDVRFDAEEPALWVPRRNPLERLMARLVRRPVTVRVALDARSAEVLRVLTRLQHPTVPDLVSAVGVTVPAQPADGDEDLAALLVFLGHLRRSGVVITEPI